VAKPFREIGFRSCLVIDVVERFVDDVVDGRGARLVCQAGDLFPPGISYRLTAGSHCLQWLEDINLLRVMVKA
jgi:hypothetical protein